MLFARPGQAHPPDSIGFELDSTKTVLTIKVDHDVKNVAKHYIVSVKVKLNGKEIVSQSFASQVDSTWQAALYKIIDAKPGDTLEATAQCNISGKKTASYVVPDE